MMKHIEYQERLRADNRAARWSGISGCVSPAPISGRSPRPSLAGWERRCRSHRGRCVGSWSGYHFSGSVRDAAGGTEDADWVT